MRLVAARAGHSAHLGFPVAGPGSFPQFMVSALAAKRLKVVLGGQDGMNCSGAMRDIW
jgi:hypothetical protein